MQPAPPSFLERLAQARRIPERARRPLSMALVLVQDFIRRDLLERATAMAYVTLLSLIPSLVAIFCVMSLFAPMVGKGNALMTRWREFILDNLASQSGQQAVAYLDRMLASLDFRTIGWSSFASVLVTLILLLRQVEEALNRIWLVRKGRNLFKRFMYFWTFLTLGMLVIGVVVGVSAGANVARVVSDVNQGVSLLAAYASWVPSFLGSFLFFFFLYKVVPNCPVAARPAAVGALASAILLAVAGYFYGLFVKNSKSYTTLYGALAQLPIFLTWLYVCWTIILLGALLAWRMQEGFPTAAARDNLDEPGEPLALLRNQQLKAALPALVLIEVYRKFSAGQGGHAPQGLAHALRVPLEWMVDAFEVLAALGYLVAAKGVADDDETALSEPFYPTYPAEQVAVARAATDLARPGDEWVQQWLHDLPLDAAQALRLFRDPRLVRRDASLADLIAALEAERPCPPSPKATAG